MEKKNKLLLTFILGLVFIGILSTGNIFQPTDEIGNLKTSDLIPNSPIFIDDDDPNFSWSKTAAENDWCSGSGTWVDPYVIENLYIDAQSSKSCIKIQNSQNSYFIIRNCYLANASYGTYDDTPDYDNAGIYINNSNNGQLINNNCSYAHGVGIQIEYSCNISVKGNNIEYYNYEMGAGIGVYRSENTTITENNIKFMNYGVILLDSKNNIIEKNVLDDNGIGLVFDNASFNTVINNTITANGAGISLIDLSNENIITKNNIYENYDGIIIYTYSSNNIISENNISFHNRWGIYLGYYWGYSNSEDNKVINNEIFENGGDGIYLRSVNYTIIANNSIKYNKANQIRLYLSYQNNVTRNDCIGYRTCIIEDNAGDNLIKDNNHQWLDLLPIFIDDADPSRDWEYSAKNYEWCSGWGTSASPYIIENVTINAQNSGSCVIIRNSARKFVIRDSTFYNSGMETVDAGIHLDQVSQAKLLNNIISNNLFGIFAIKFDHSVISGNMIKENNYGIYLEFDPFSSNSDIIINNNEIRGNPFGIYIKEGSRIEITENSFNFNHLRNLYINFGNDNIIAGNRFKNIILPWPLPQSQGMVFSNCYNSTISGNNVSDSGIGIKVIESDFNHFWQNRIENTEIGINISNSEENDLLGNLVTGSEYSAILIHFSHNNLISDNMIVENVKGIHLSTSYFNDVTNNIITENSAEGILIENGLNNTLTENEIHQNGKGLSIIDLSALNLIYNNKFIGNGINTEDNSTEAIQLSYLEDTVSPATVPDYTGVFGCTPVADYGDWYFTDAYKDDDGNYFYLRAANLLQYPGTISLKWGEYNDFDDSIAANLLSISINFEVWADSWPGVLDQSSNLRIIAYDNLGHSTSYTIASTPGHQVHYTGSMSISSGSIFDTVKAGGYIKHMEVSMYCNEEILTNTWINIDYVDIYYNYLGIFPLPWYSPIRNQWDNGTIGNFYDDYVGEDLDDDGIGDDPVNYTIPGTAGNMDRYPIYWDKYELLMDIIPLFEDCYMGDEINFDILLSDLFGNDINLPLDVLEQYAYWDAHESVRTHFSSFNNLSGTIFQNETGSPTFATLPDLGMLNFSMYPYSSIMVAPEILEFNPVTQFSRQRIETYFQLDLDYIFSLYNLELKDISYIDATLFGAHFLESLYISDLIQSFGKIEIYNYLTDSYRLLSNHIFDDALELGNINNPLTSENITDYTFGFDADELHKYVDQNNVITFRFYSYFEGYLSNPQDSYLSHFKDNAVLGTFLDYISFDVVWWKDTPDKITYEETSLAYPDATYTYIPTCPGTYTITFRVRPSADYKTIEKNYTITVKRRPVNITLDLPSLAYTTEKFNIVANVTDYLTGTAAINAKVNFYADYDGSVTLIGTAIANSEGLATLEMQNMLEGMYWIHAEVIHDHGQNVKPFKDDPFNGDIWDTKTSQSYFLLMVKSSTQLELSSLAPEGNDVVVGQEFFVYAKLIDLFNGDEVYYENIDVYINSIMFGTYNSSQPFLISFSEPGQILVEIFYEGSPLLENSYDSSIFDVKRLYLSIVDISPPESIFLPNQYVFITISALDLALNLQPIENLEINFYCNLTGILNLLDSGFTGPDGTITFQVQISEDWAGQVVSFYAENTPKPGFYLQQKTTEAPLIISPFSTNILLDINEEDLYVWEFYELNFSLVNLGTLNLIENQILNIEIKSGDFYLDIFSVITSDSDSVVYNFTLPGIYEIFVDYSGSGLHLPCFNNFTIEILKRPTYVTIEITDKPLVPGYEFSITVNLIDAIRSQIIMNKYIQVIENIYDDGSIAEIKDSFLVNTEYTNTFQWIPLRSADFEFIFTFNYDEFNQDAIYEFSSHSVIYEVEKREVLIETSINEFSFKIGDLLKINSTFTDLNTTSLDPIPNLTVHYLIQDGETILYSENHTTDSFGVIYFEWQIPSSLVNRTFTVSIITAKTNVYHFTIQQFELSTLPLDTFFNIVVNPASVNYITEEIFFNFELMSIRGDAIQEKINYIIFGETSLYYETGIIDLTQSQIFSTILTIPDRYFFTFFYNGSDIYAPTSEEITYFIELFPSSLELIEHPQFIFSSQLEINVTYLLLDVFTQEPIAGSEVRLYYVDLETSSKIELSLSAITNSEGKVNFIFTLPETYSYSSVILIAEAGETSLNKIASNTFELFISKTPTYINIDISRISENYYIDESLILTFELYDYFGNLITSEPLQVIIETPLKTLVLDILSTQSIKLNFTELGLYEISVVYNGSDELLTSECLTYFAVSPVSTSLAFIEVIPDILYGDQFLFLRVQLTNNITHVPIEGKIIKIYITDGTSTTLIFEGVTDNNGIISYIWDVDPIFINQNIEVFATYDYEYYYQDSTTDKIPLFISRYDVNLFLIEFPEIITPFTENRVYMQAYREQTGEIAQNCHLQIYILLPNGSKILLFDEFTDNNGFIDFYWIATEMIFEFDEITFEFYVIQDELYNDEFALIQIVPVEKLQTTLIIIPEKYYVQQGEEILIEFDLANVYGTSLSGQMINIEITNPLFSINFIVEMGFNDSYAFLIPYHGMFEITGTYEGNNRYYPSNNTVLILSEKFEYNIELSILEAFTKNETVSILGGQWNYSILDYQQNFTLVANVSSNDFSIPLEGIVVNFYFLQHFQQYILLGTNITNSEGIAIFYWDTSNYSMPNWWQSSALLAKIEETEYNYAAESEPIYFTLRDIYTFISIDTITSYFRIDVPYRINFTLYDEFWNTLEGFEIIINIFDPYGAIIATYHMQTNETTHVYFTPSMLGNYKIKASFSGTEQYHESLRTKFYTCIEKEPTKIWILMPTNIQPGALQSITVKLVNSTGGLLIGEIVKVGIMYHDASGKTEYYYVDVIIGLNSTFNWIFPESDEYIIRATYEGSNEYKACRDTQLSFPRVFFRFSFWELFFFLIAPAIMIIPSSEEKKSRWNKKKKILTAIFVIFALLGSLYAGIGDICSQVETTGLIEDLHGETDYQPDNSIVDLQAQDTFNDVFNYGASQISKIETDDIPNFENDTSPYDIIIQNSTIIPPEADENPPVIRFIGLSSGDTLFGTKKIEIDVYDRETGIQNVILKMLHLGIFIVLESDFDYNETLDSYTFSLDTINYEDGEYEIYAIAVDNNDNNKTISASIEILNNPIYDFEEFEIENIATELTDTINVSFTSLANGRYKIQIKDIETDNTILYLTGNVSADEFIQVQIPIDPFLFKAGLYKIFVSVSIRNDLLYYQSETQEMNLEVMKESVRLKIDIREGEDLFSNHYIHLRAQLIENDFIYSEEGYPEQDEASPSIPGQKITFEIADSDYQEKLGSVITDTNGFASLIYNLTLSKGFHAFNVTFDGNNLYKPLEGMKVFENKGKFVDIQLTYFSSPLAYNEIGIIKAKMYGDKDVIPDKSLYFDISNSLNNYYLGMAMTNANGEATIRFPGNILPGLYDISVGYDGDPVYAKNVTIFRDKFEVELQDADLSIITGSGSVIFSPYRYNTELNAKLLVNNTDIGIEGIPLNFKLVSFGVEYFIGTELTNSNGRATIDFNPSDHPSILPGVYYFIVTSESSEYYNGDEDIVDLVVSKDIPIISIQGTESLYYKDFTINATLTDSLFNPIEDEILYFSILNSSNGEVLHSNAAATNSDGLASLSIMAGQFNYTGKFDIEVIYLGNNLFLSTSQLISEALNIIPIQTQLIINGPQKGNVIEPYEIEIFLVDSEGIPVTNQIILVECYKKDGITNLLKPNTFVITDNYGKANFTVNITIPNNYIIKAFYTPLLDDSTDNDGFLNSYDEISFIIERVSADLSIPQRNLPFIMRGDELIFKVKAGLKEAKEDIIPINIFVDIDLNGDGIKHDDIFRGFYRYIEDGIATISYKLPTDGTFQAGEYNFSVVIDEEWSRFTGTTWFLIDLVERTSLSIKYYFPNPRTENKHYIWETEIVEFILCDEDGDALVENIEIQNGSFINTNRFIQYQFVNGRTIFDYVEMDLIHGNYSTEHVPTTYGYETCTVFYEGSRFFAPTKDSETEYIRRRPLILNFLDFHHDNEARTGTPYSGHRGENILITASVQDYLNQTYLENHEVYFGFNGRYLTISGITNDVGIVSIEVPLTEYNGLIQAGIYELGLKIDKTEKYQFIKSSAANRLYIFEKGHVEINAGSITVADFNFILKPTINFYDEDDQLITGIPFYLQVINRETGEVVHDEVMYSGKTEIPFYDSGDYDLVFTITNNNESLLDDLVDLVDDFLNDTQFFEEWFDVFIRILDQLIWGVIIPFISDVLEYALALCVNWEGQVWTFIILVLLNILMGSLTKDLSFTWMTLLKVLLISIIFGLANHEKTYYRYLGHFGLIVGLFGLVSLMTGSLWLLIGIGVIMIVSGLYGFKRKDITKAKIAQDEKKFDGNLILLELLILCVAGILEFIGNALGIFKTFAGTLAYNIWLMTHQFAFLVPLMGLANAIIFIIVVAIIDSIITPLLYMIFPPTGGAWWWIIIKNILRNILRYTLIAIMFALITIYFSPGTITLSIFAQQFGWVLLGFIIETIMGHFLSESNQFQTVVSQSSKVGM